MVLDIMVEMTLNLYLLYLKMFSLEFQLYMVMVLELLSEKMLTFYKALLMLLILLIKVLKIKQLQLTTVILLLN